MTKKDIKEYIVITLLLLYNNSMRLYNTLTRTIEEFIPINPKQISFYQCGPTVYWTQHIGNLRAMTMADLIRRSLIYQGFDVTFVRNYTDVGHLTSDADSGEDKMDKAAKREKKSPHEVANMYIKIFEDDVNKLNLLEPTYKPRASEFVNGMIEMIQILLNTHQAYQTEQAIYFDVSTFPKYNQLNKQKLESNKKGFGHGTGEDPLKKHFTDFALWFFKKGRYENALQTWNSPWGVGFPGWHIECSVMIKQLLGNTIDIHMGGIEHISIHHTNEIAQSESANKTPFVHYWIHNEHLTNKGDKMAKSQGTGFSLDELIEKGFDPLALRYFFLSAHYRTRQDFSFEALSAAQTALQNIRNIVSTLLKQKERVSLSEEKMSLIDNFQDRFQNSLSNDFQIPQVLGVFWEMIKSNIPSLDKLDLINEFDQVLGLKLSEVTANAIPQSIIELAEKRKKARESGNYSLSDEIRKKINDLGFDIEDSNQKYVIKKSS